MLQSVVSGKSTETDKCESLEARRLSRRRKEILWSIVNDPVNKL